MISFPFRFHGHSSLRYVYKNGQAIRSRLMTVKYSSNPHRKKSRYSVIVSKKVLKSAVGRNRIRRRIYEIIRLENEKIPGIYDVAIIVVSSEVISTSPDNLIKLIQELFESASLYKKTL